MHVIGQLHTESKEIYVDFCSTSYAYDCDNVDKFLVSCFVNTKLKCNSWIFRQFGSHSIQCGLEHHQISKFNVLPSLLNALQK